MAQGLGTRDYLIEEYTKALCPLCHEAGGFRSDDPDVFKDAMLVQHSGKIWMRRFCQKHGEVESLYEEHADLWKSRDGWSTPTSPVTPDRADNYAAFPDGYRDGLPVAHGQHTCILLLNITQHCNYKCPTCYASALEPGTKRSSVEHPTLQELEHTVDTVIKREGGRLGVLMISGGEPTVRSDISEILRVFSDKPITRVMLNTNGRRIAKDDAFVELLNDLRERVEVYLQFDGFRERTHEILRGEKVGEEKLRALRRLDEAAVVTTLVTTAARGVNEDELGDVLKLGLETQYCSGMMVQPVFGSGRGSTIDGLDRLTPTGAIKKISDQSDGVLQPDDFIPLPCSHKDCCDIAYLIKDKSDEWQSVVRMVGRGRLKEQLHLVSNTISFEGVSSAVKELVKSGALQRIFSEQQRTSSLQIAQDIFNLCGCFPGIPELIGAVADRKSNRKSGLKSLSRRTFRITVKMFMDAHTFHEARIRQCCVHTGTFEDDPRRYSFCWRWLFSDAQDFPDRDREGLTALRTVR